MSDWVVFLRSTRTGGLAQAPTSTSKENALSFARSLKRQGSEVVKIEGPNGEVLDKEEIERWIAANPE